MDAEDRVAMGFGDKRLEWSVGWRVKEWTGDRDLGHRLFQNRRAFFWRKFDKPNGLRLVPTAEGHLARGSGVAHPGHLAIGGYEPAIRAFLHQGHRRRIWFAAASPAHRQQMGASRSQTYQKEGIHQSIEQATPTA